MGQEKNLGTGFVDVQFRPAWKELDRAVSAIERRFSKIGVDAGNRLSQGLGRAVQKMKEMDRAGDRVSHSQNQMQREMRETDTQAGRSSAMMDKLRMALAAVAGSYVAARTIGLVKNQVMGLYQEGVRTNAQMEVMSVSFEKMIGSARRAGKMLDQLRDFSARTPLLFPQIMKSATGLLATKKVAEKDLLPTIKKLADAAAGSTEGFAAFPRIVRAINQMLSKGRLQAEEMMQLAEAGIPAWKALADAMGVTIGKAREMGERGKLGPKQILKLIDGLGEAYEGLADKQSKTFQGLTSTLKDKVGLLAAKAFKPIFDFAKLRLNLTLKILETPYIRRAANAFADLSERVIDTIKWASKNPWAHWAAGAAIVSVGFASVAASLAGIALTASFIGPHVFAIAAGAAALSAALVVSLKAVKDSFDEAASGDGGKMMISQLKEIGYLANEATINLRDGFLLANRAAALLLASTRKAKAENMSLWNTWVSGVKIIMDRVSLWSTDWTLTQKSMKLEAFKTVLAIMDRVENFSRWMSGKAAWIAGSWVGAFEWMADKLKSVFGDLKIYSMAVTATIGEMWDKPFEKLTDFPALVKETFEKNLKLMKLRSDAGPADTLGQRASGRANVMEDAFLALTKENPFSALRKIVEGMQRDVENEMQEMRSSRRLDRTKEATVSSVRATVTTAIKNGLLDLFDLLREAKPKDAEEEERKKKKASRFGQSSIEGLYNAIQNSLNKSAEDKIKDEAIKQTVLQEKINEGIAKLVGGIPGAATAAGSMLGKAITGDVSSPVDAIKGAMGSLGALPGAFGLGLTKDQLDLGRAFNSGKVEPVTGVKEKDEEKKKLTALERLVGQGEDLNGLLTGMLGFGS